MMNPILSKSMKNLMVAIFVLSVSACSLRDRQKAPTISVNLPQEWVSAVSSRSFTTMATSGSNSSFETPTSIDSLNCFAINVKGPGILPDPRFNCDFPDKGPSQVAGFVPVTSASMELMVPVGAARTIQLIGVQSTIGCPDLNTLLANQGQDAFKDTIGEPYLLGEATIDVFDDVGVSILAQLDTSKKAFEGCRSESSGSSSNTTVNPPSTSGNSIHVGVVAGVANVMQGACSKFHVSVSSSGTAAPPLHFTSSSLANGSIAFYKTSACAAADLITENNPLSFAASDFFEEVYVKVSPNAGQNLIGNSFSITPVPQTGEWSVYGPTFSVVGQQLFLTNNSLNGAIGSCQPIALSLSNQNGTTVTLNGVTFDLTIETSTGTTAPLTQLYLGQTACQTGSGAISVTSVDQSFGRVRSRYLLTGSADTMTYYLKSADVENGFLSVSKPSVQPTGTGYSFYSTTSGGGTASYPPPNITSPSTSSYTSSTDITLSGTCQSGLTVFLFNSVSTTPMMQTGCTTGQFNFALTASAGTTNQYQIKQGVLNGQMSNSVSFLWTKTSGGFSQSNPYTCTNCTIAAPNQYTFPRNASVIMNPNTTTTFTSCSLNGALPPGLMLNYATCQITGSPNAPGTYSANIMGSVPGLTSSQVTVSFTIQ
jgi:hypothetical protein